MKEYYKKTEEIIMHTSFIPLKTTSGESSLEKNKAFSKKIDSAAKIFL